MNSKTGRQSVEPKIADLANGWLKSCGLDYKLEQESLNSQIDTALAEYHSKNGGKGGNRPDAKLLLRGSDTRFYPVLIEYKGYKDKLVKLDKNGQVENRTDRNEPNYRNINSYAVNGAVHYANAILHYTNYEEIFAVGVTGWRDDAGKLRHKIGVYYVAKSNFGMGQEVGAYTDFSFLQKENFDDFLAKAKALELSEDERDALKGQREQEIIASLVKLNNDIYKNEKGLGPDDRVYLVVASIMATLGVPGKVEPLEKADLRSSSEQGNTDGDIMLRKIHAFLSERALPEDKRAFIERTLQNTITAANINKVENGETQLRRVFAKIVDDLGIYYKIGLTTDFTGKLFNEMYSWLGYSQDNLNDVVLTPPYIAKLLVKLARTNKDSYVWDNATGSAGLLVAAMNEMLRDARETIASPEELRQKEIHIRTQQLLGLEILPGIYMLAVLNMILMGDGSSCILNEDSLRYFASEGAEEKHTAFPADVFILNPPYSAPGNGMVFVQSALGRMNKGYAAVIIQNSAGSGKAVEYNREILKRNTLLASIKMPVDLFLGRSSVQTNIYVFRVGERHEKDSPVKFIDFSNDGYTRTNRKKSRVNLRDTDHAEERYEELVNLVKFGQSKLFIFTEKEYYEGTIDPTNGADWNQSTPMDRKPVVLDFRTTVSDYLVWEVSNILRGIGINGFSKPDDFMIEELLKSIVKDGSEWKQYMLSDIFEMVNTKSIPLKDIASRPGDTPYVTAALGDNGVMAYVSCPKEWIDKGNCIMIGGKTLTFSYQENDFCSNDSHNIALYLKDTAMATKTNYLFLIAALRASLRQRYSWGNSISMKKIKSEYFYLPANVDGKPNFSFMERFVRIMQEQHLRGLEKYIKSELYRQE